MTGATALALLLAGAPSAATLPDLPWMPSEGVDRIGEPAPEWKDVEWLQGGPLSVQELRGKVILLRFWLVGCPYCTRTAPALNRLHREYSERGLVVVGLHHPKSEQARDHEVVLAEARRLAFEFPVGTDDDWTTLDRYWTDVPGRSFTSVTFLIDREGVIRFLHDGGEFFPGPDEAGQAHEAIETMIERLLAEKEPGDSVGRARTPDDSALQEAQIVCEDAPCR